MKTACAWISKWTLCGANCRAMRLRFLFSNVHSLHKLLLTLSAPWEGGKPQNVEATHKFRFKSAWMKKWASCDGQSFLGQIASSCPPKIPLPSSFSLSPIVLLILGVFSQLAELFSLCLWILAVSCIAWAQKVCSFTQFTPRDTYPRKLTSV